jgi:tRNA(Arg) A34 adenosine deaminase TadA
MKSIKQMLQLAADYAPKHDERSFWIGAVGIRGDGAIVFSRNGCSKMIAPELHAEFRLTRKLDVGATIFVARIYKKSRLWANARPCRNCRRMLKSRKVKKIYYTISNNEYGVIDLDQFIEKRNPKGIKLHKFDKRRWIQGES